MIGEGEFTFTGTSGKILMQVIQYLTQIISPSLFSLCSITPRGTYDM